MRATTQAKHGSRLNVPDVAQVAHTPPSLSCEPPRAMKQSNRDTLVAIKVEKDALHITVALLTHFSNFNSRLSYTMG